MITSLRSQLTSLDTEQFNIYTNPDFTDEQRSNIYEQIKQQKQIILDQINDIWSQVQTSLGKKPLERGIFDQVEAEEIRKDAEIIGDQFGKMQESVLTAMQQSAHEKIKDLRTTVDKYEMARKFFLRADSFGTPFSEVKENVKKLGLDPDSVEYDYYSSIPIRERRFYIDDFISGKSGNDLWNTLVSLRRESVGTGNPVLSSEIISDLVDEGIISKYAGQQLRKISFGLNEKGEPVIKLKMGEGGSTKLSDLKKVSSLIEQRNKSVTQAMKIRNTKIKTPKIKFLKPPKVKTIKMKSLSAPSPKFILRLPKTKKINSPGRIRNLVYARRSF